MVVAVTHIALLWSGKLNKPTIPSSRWTYEVVDSTPENVEAFLLYYP